MANGGDDDDDDESSQLELTKSNNNLLDSSLDDIDGDGTERTQLDSSNHVQVQMAINVTTGEQQTHTSNDDANADDNDTNNITPPSKVLSNSAIKAMGILEVLEMVVKYLPFRKLLKLRLLSKTWNDAIIPQIRQRHTPILFSDMKKLYEFLNMNLKSCKIIFTKYNASRISFMSKGMVGLFSICGHFITELEVTIPNGHTKYFVTTLARLVNLVQLRLHEESSDFLTNVDYEDKMVDGNPYLNVEFFNYEAQHYENNNRLPCLLKLRKMKVTFSHNAAIRKETEACMMELLAATINLQFLSNCNDWHADVCQIFTFNKSILCKFTSLGEMPLTMGHLEFLMDLTKNHGIVLKKVSFGDYTSNVFDEQDYVVQLEEFLNLQANSLKSLKFNRTSARRSNINVKLPIIIGLTKLELGVRRNSSFSFDSFNNNFPILKEMKLVYLRQGLPDDDDDDDDDDDLRHVSDRDVWISHMNEFVPHPNLQILEMNEYAIKSNQQMEELATLFPKISLEIKLKSLQLMSIIWAKLPRLQILKITKDTVKRGEVGYQIQSNSNKNSSAIIDELMTGIPKEVHNSLKLRLHNEPHQDILRTSKTKPGITDLKELKEFKLFCSRSMTDISGYFGFSFPGTKISLECREENWKIVEKNSRIHNAQKYIFSRIK